MRKTILLLAMLSAAQAPATAAETTSCSAASGDTRIALLELYTSEGCSSCPPADEWLASFRGNGLHPARVAPLALHVDYWDYLGWKDPYSQALFSRRQEQMARANRTRAIYTPQLLLNGKELRRWRFQGEDAIRRAASESPRADITLKLARADGRLDIEATAHAADGAGHADLFVVVYENNLVNAVRAGENRGRTLRHDFVAREWFGPVALRSNGAAQFTQHLQPGTGWKAGDLGVVAFVQDRDSGEVWQALARPPCP